MSDEQERPLTAADLDRLAQRISEEVYANFARPDEETNPEAQHRRFEEYVRNRQAKKR